MNYQAWINGQAIAQVSAWERGLFYGDGFFTTLLCYQQTLMNWPNHWQRIKQSCVRLGFELPVEAQVLHQLLPALQACSKQEAAVIKLVFTRGEGGVGYAPPPRAEPRCYVYLNPLPPGLVISSSRPPELKTLNVIRCETPIAESRALAGIKHLNRLEQVLARQEVVAQGVDEGLMLNERGQVICATQANLFLIRRGQVLTPCLQRSGVMGTCLQGLRDLRKDLDWQTLEMTWDDVMQAEAIALCNAVRGVQAVANLAGKTFDTRLIAPIKIGRASCRERVSLFVYI